MKEEVMEEVDTFRSESGFFFKWKNGCRIEL